MRAADNTIAFVKDWIEGKLTKRQYMHYYIVKTPHAQFLMKANKSPELVAIKDSFGHIFITNKGFYDTGLDSGAQSPFVALFSVGFTFPYTSINEASINALGIGKNLSKWRTLDHMGILNTDSTITVNLSLIEIGETRYITEPYLTPEGILNLVEWANYEDIKKCLFSAHIKDNKLQPHVKLLEVNDKPIKVADIRKAYVTYAGEAAEASTIDSRWIHIPTSMKCLNETADKDIKAIIKTRPICYNYGLTSDIVSPEQAWRRTEFPFRPEILHTYGYDNVINTSNIPKKGDFLSSGDLWREFLTENMDSDLADNLIRFLDDDDKWLMEHGHIIIPLLNGRAFQSNLLQGDLCGYTVMVEEENPSMIPKHVAYVKGSISGKKHAINISNFTKVIPAPHTDQINQIQGFIINVRI